MESLYSQSFEITNAECDAFHRLKPSALLGYMQEVAGNHYGNPKDYPSLVWVVSRHHVVIRRMPMLGERITLETWAHPATRSAFPRGAIAYDEKGEELFRSISLWVLLDTQTHSMVVPGKAPIALVSQLRGLELPNPGSLAPRNFPQICSRRVYYSLLDANHHMNNTRYLDWVEDLNDWEFHRTRVLREFTICYLSEATPGETVDIGYETDGGILSVDARSVGSRVFAVQAEYGPA